MATKQDFTQEPLEYIYMIEWRTADMPSEVWESVCAYKSAEAAMESWQADRVDNKKIKWFKQYGLWYCRTTWAYSDTRVTFRIERYRVYG